MPTFYCFFSPSVAITKWPSWLLKCQRAIFAVGWTDASFFCQGTQNRLHIEGQCTWLYTLRWRRAWQSTGTPMNWRKLPYEMLYLGQCFFRNTYEYAKYKQLEHVSWFLSIFEHILLVRIETIQSEGIHATLYWTVLATCLGKHRQIHKTIRASTSWELTVYLSRYR